MRSVTKFSSSYKVRLVLSLEGLEAIKHIVSIAPQEAQWFHCIDKVDVHMNTYSLHLSTKLYIPKQLTSIAEVNSNSQMMIDFYQDLLKQYSDTNIVNRKLQTMNCWCHSHHNMEPLPSIQDQNQFNNFITQSIDQGLSNWQVMLIFNKKDNFYSKVFDPVNNLVSEGVDISVVNPSYDFSYIDTAAKEKFIKKNFSSLITKPPLGGSSPPFLFSSSQREQSSQESQSVSAFIEDIVEEIYFPLKKKITPRTKAKVNQSTLIHLKNALLQNISTTEYYWLLFALTSSESLRRKIYGIYLPSSNNKKQLFSTDTEPAISEYFLATTDSLKDFTFKLDRAIAIAEIIEDEFELPPYNELLDMVHFR